MYTREGLTDGSSVLILWDTCHPVKTGRFDKGAGRNALRCSLLLKREHFPRIQLCQDPDVHLALFETDVGRMLVVDLLCGPGGLTGESIDYLVKEL